MFSISNFQKFKVPVKLDIPSTHKFLKGCNWAGMALSDAQLPFVNGTTGSAPSAAEITYIVNKGFNSVRLLIKQEVLQGNNTFASGLNKPYTDFAATPWGLFKTAVESLTSQGIYVILARHQGLDAQFGQAFGSAISGAGGPNPASVLSDFWRKMVEAFGATNPLIGYSIDNEPLLGGGQGGWWDIAQECINTIRRAGSGQCIFIPGISYSGPSTWSSVPWNDPAPTGGVSNATKFLTLTDPCDNIIAELHAYFSAEDSGAVENNVASGTIGRERLANVVAWANTNNKRFIIGEFGSKAGITNSNENIIDYVQYCKQNSSFLNGGKGCVGMQWWTFGSNAFWANYAYTLAKQGANPPGGTDSAQMTLLETANFFSDPVALVDPASQVLHTYFNMADRNVGANSIVSRPSAGNSGSHSTATNGSNGGINGTLNGQTIVVGTGYWLRLGTMVENLNPYVAPLNDFMWTTTLQLTTNPLGTSATAYSAQTKIFGDSSSYWGAYLYRSGGVNYIGVCGSGVSPGTGLTYNFIGTQPAPALNIPFVLQWGLVSRKLVFRINLGPWTEAVDVNYGTTVFPADATYGIGSQNFHFGYSNGGATYYYNGNLGDIYSTIGTNSQDVYDQLTYWAMVKYGIAS